MPAALGARAEVDLADASGATAAFLAARNDAAPCLELLVGASADLNRARASGATPLYVAAQNDSRRCLGTLLAAGADANLAKEGGFTPLCIGVLRGQKEVVATLLRGRADADQPYTIADRFTPLMIAAHLGHVEIATLLAQNGASLGRRDAAGRTAQQVAAAAKQGLAEAAIVAQSEEVARESTLVAQEAMLQELRQLRPVQSHLEVEAAKLEQLQLQAATFASEEGVFGGASALQEACTTLASDLLPAGRMLTELAQLDADASRMEAPRHARRHPPARTPFHPALAAHLPLLPVPLQAHLAQAEAALRARQEAVSAAPADLTLVAARDTARKAHAEALTALRQRYEQKESRADRYAQASERVAAIGGAADTTPAGLSAEAAAAAMPRALESSLPVLRLCTEEIAAANRKTVAALDTLLNAMSEELAPIRSVKGPLHDACTECDGAIRGGSIAIAGDTPRADLSQLAVLLADVRAREAAAARADSEREAAAAAMRDLEGLQEEELQLADAADELQLRLAKAQRHNQPEEIQRLLGEKAQLNDASAAMRQRAADAQRALRQPTLLAHYPEMRRLLAIKAGADRSEAGARGVVDEKTTREHSEIVREIGAAPGVRRYAARPRGVAGVDLEIAELALPRDAAFEAAHEKLGALRSPLLALPSRIFYDVMQPAVTLVATPRPDGAASLAPWVAECRGGGAAAAGGIGALLHRLAPAFLAAAYLHRLGVSHRALTPGGDPLPPRRLPRPHRRGLPQRRHRRPVHGARAHPRRSGGQAQPGGSRQLLPRRDRRRAPQWCHPSVEWQHGACRGCCHLGAARAAARPADGAAADAWALCARAVRASPPAARLTLSRRSPLAALLPPSAPPACSPVAGPPRAAVLRAAAAGRMGVPLGAPAASADGDDTPAWLSSAATILEPTPSPTPSPPPSRRAAAADAWPPPPSKPAVAAPAWCGGWRRAAARQRRIIVRDGGGASLVEAALERGGDADGGGRPQVGASERRHAAGGAPRLSGLRAFDGGRRLQRRRAPRGRREGRRRVAALPGPAGGGQRGAARGFG